VRERYGTGRALPEILNPTTACAVLAHDGHDRACGEYYRQIIQHQARSARIGTRHVLEPDPVPQNIRNWQIP